MKRLSYAQRMEDEHLRLIFAGEPPGFYVDVGGGHPVADNVSFAFYLQGWRGLVVEPQARLAALHRKIRPRDVVIESLVGRHEGDATFHEVERLHGFSSMRLAQAREAERLGARVTAVTKPVTTLARLFEHHDVGDIAFLKVDVEGAEADVIAGMDLARWRPRVLIIEAVEPGSMASAWAEWEPPLLAQGYRLGFFDGLNRFYVRVEDAALIDRFPAAPLDWGSVVHLYAHGRAAESPDHPDRALARALVAGVLAELPHLDPAEIMRFARMGAEHLGLALPALDPASDAFRAALGRIAAGYDGGQLFEE